MRKLKLQICESFSTDAFYAIVASLSAAEVVEWFDTSCVQEWRLRTELFKRLEALLQLDASVGDLARVIVDSLETDALRPAGLRGRADASLRYFIQLLPPAEQADRAMRYLSHHRPSRRKLALKILREAEARDHADLLLEYAKTNRNTDVLFCAIALGVKIEQPLWALELTGDDYLGARVLQTIIADTNASRYAKDYPRAFAWAVGRAEAHHHGDVVVSNLERALSASADIGAPGSSSEQKDLIGISFWALGRLQRRDDIVRLGKTELRR